MSRRPPAWQAKRLLEWSKAVLIQIAVEDNDLVCDLWCGPGSNISKFVPTKAQFYLGLDPFDECLAQAKKQWDQERRGDMEADFRKLNPVDGDYAIVFDGVGAQLGEFDVVTCFGKLQLAWGTEECAMRFLHNVASVLKPGGLFIGFMPDPEAVWSLSQKRCTEKEPPHASKELFSIRFHSHEQGLFGARYNLQMEDGKGAQQFFLVHLQTLMELAAQYGLETIEMVNMASYYQDNHYQFRELLATHSVIPDPSKSTRIPEPVMDLFGLFTTFVFRKVEDSSMGEAATRP